MELILMEIEKIIVPDYKTRRKTYKTDLIDFAEAMKQLDKKIGIND